MKKLLLIAFTLMTNLAFSTGEKYEYEIAIENVSDYPSAKMVTDLLRETFEASPSFDDDSDTFVIKTDAEIGELSLITILENNSYTLTKYKKTEL